VREGGRYKWYGHDECSFNKLGVGGTCTEIQYLNGATVSITYNL
jgi:hypothetical protein